MRVERALPFFGLALAACARSTSLPLPDEPGAQSLLAFQAPQQGLLAVPADIADVGQLDLVFSLDDKPALVFFAETLAELELAAGQPIPSAGATGGHLPPALATHRLQVLDPPEWEREEGLDAAFAEFRIPRLEPAECVAADRCYGSGAQDQNSCIECPAVEYPADLDHLDEVRFGACPTGWAMTQTSSSASTVCRALDAGVPNCDAASLLHVDAGCQPLGPACPTGEWPSPLPAADRYVGASVPAGVAPADVYATLDAALLGAPAGTHVLVGQGDFSLSGIGSAVSIEGACVGGTRILAASSAMVTASAELSHLSVAGDALAVGAGIKLTLTQARVERTWIRVDGELSGHELFVRSATLAVSGRADLSQLEWHGPGPMVLGADASMSVSDAVLKGDRAGSNGPSSFDGAMLSVERTLVYADYDSGIFVAHGGRAQVDMAEARGTMVGMSAISGGQITATRLLINGSGVFGLMIAGGQVTLNDTEISNVGDRRTDFSAGIVVSAPSSGLCAPTENALTALRLHIERVNADGIYLLCAKAQLDHWDGIRLAGSGLVIAGSDARGGHWHFGSNARGITMEGVDEPDRGLFRRASLDASQIEVERTDDQGLSLGKLSDITLDAVAIDGTSGGGFALGGPNTKAVVTNLTVEHIRRPGRAAAILVRGTDFENELVDLDVKGFLVEESVVGLDVRGSTQVRMRDGWFRRNSVVFQVTSAIDPRRLLQGVRLEANGTLGL